MKTGRIAMRAAVFRSAREPLRIEDVSMPAVAPDQVLLRVRACGVCRTDLHIVEGDLPLRLSSAHSRPSDRRRSRGGCDEDLPLGARVGVSWIGGVDGTWGSVGTAWRISATHRLSPATRSTAATPSSRSRAPTSFFPCPRTRRLARRAAALRRHHRLSQPARGRRRARRTRRALRLRRIRTPGHRGSAASGTARSMFPRAARRTAAWPNRWARSGSEAKSKSLPWNSTAPSPSRPAEMSWSRRLLPAQRRSRRHQRHPSRPHSAIRLRSPALGRAPDSQRREHDPRRRPRLPQVAAKFDCNPRLPSFLWIRPTKHWLR